MAKIVGLIPCLMLDNNRDANNEAIEHNYKHLNLDAIAIYDQAFQETDYDDRFIYVGHQPDRVGTARTGSCFVPMFFIKCKNMLLHNTLQRNIDSRHYILSINSLFHSSFQ